MSGVKTEQHRLDCAGCTYSTAWEYWVANFARTCAINHEMLGDAHVVTIHHRVGREVEAMTEQVEAAKKSCNCDCDRCAVAGASWAMHCNTCVFYGSASLPDLAFQAPAPALEEKPKVLIHWCPLCHTRRGCNVLPQGIFCGTCGTACPIEAVEPNPAPSAPSTVEAFCQKMQSFHNKYNRWRSRMPLLSWPCRAAQPDSSSISTEQTFEEWWDSYLDSPDSIKNLGYHRICRLAWNAAKGLK